MFAKKQNHFAFAFALHIGIILWKWRVQMYPDNKPFSFFTGQIAIAGQ